MTAHLPRCNAAIYPYGAVCQCDQREALATEFHLTHAEVDALLTEAWELNADPAELAAARQQAETVHACPPGNSSLTPCCGKTPFELTRTDRLTYDLAEVTCRAALTVGES